MTKRITVDLTLSWTFDEKDWSEEKNHIQDLKDNPNIVLGYDIINACYCMNDIVNPELKELKVHDAN